MKWGKVKVGDCCEVTSSKRIFFSEYVDSGVPFYRSKEIIESSNGQAISEPLFISQEKYDEIKNHFGVPQSGDMLLTSVGTIGVPYIVREKDYFYFKDGNLTWFRNFSDELDSKYLYFWVKSSEGQSVLNNTTIGSSQKALTIASLKGLEIPCPPAPVQKRIVEFLAGYDDLIENNQKQIKLLEEAAQRLYKEWFVDLRFPGYETTPIVDGIPEGWSMCTAGNVIEFNPKTPLKKGCIKQSVPMTALSTSSMVLNSTEFTMTESNSGAKFRNGDTLLARITPCLENGKTAFVAGITSEEGAVGSTEFIVMRAKKINPYMVYLLARTEEFRKTAINSMTGSDGRQRAQVDKIMQFPYLLAPQSTLEAFSQLVEPIFEQVYLKNSQIAQLSQARDRLLPKLMSGELEV